MMPLRTIPPLNILDTTSNNAGIVLHLDAELNHMLLGINTSSRTWLTTKHIFSKPGSLVEISHAHSFKGQWVTAPKVLVLAIDQGQTQQKYELVHDLTLSFCSLNMQATIDV